MARLRPLRLVPLGDVNELRDGLLLDGPQTLLQLLERTPALSLDPLTEEEMGWPLERFDLAIATVAPSTPLFRPPGLTLPGPNGRRPVASITSGEAAAASPASAEEPARQGEGGAPADEAAGPSTDDAPGPHPAALADAEAVLLAYRGEIEAVASFLRSRLSVLVLCDKLVVEHLWRRMVLEAAMTPVLLEVPPDEGGGLMPRNHRQRQLEALKSLTRALKDGQVLVVPHLDLLAGGADSNLPGEAREIIEVLYGESDRLLLAFADRALALSEVLAARFAVRLQVTGVPQEVRYGDGRTAPLGAALVTRSERDHFRGFEPALLYKNVAGMNPVRLRQALRYAVQERPAGSDVSRLIDAIRAFKAQTSTSFEVPDVTFDDIGGYERVKEEILRALALVAGSFEGLSAKLQRELIPRGFIFHGPPGTGKTLFAKAIANQLNATILVISGPEVTDMYVGESERKVREIFAEARRNAPSVLVFDEFDSIAAERSGRSDGGSRAGNAIVTQILTEMDGFRPDVPMLVIGTTNRIDIIDEALLRPSRFQAVEIGLPDRAARRAIAEVHARHFGVEAEAALLEVIADASSGFNGDEIRSLFRDALVGLACQKPPIAADAGRFGRLVGRIRLAREQRAAQAPLRRQARPIRPDERPRPSEGLTDLVGESPTEQS